MNALLMGETSVKRPPTVVEIVGLAGAGKTTLCQALRQRHEKIVVGVHLSKLRFISFLISNILVLLPAFVRQYWHSRWFTWRETRAMVYIKAWHHFLNRPAPNADTVTVLDHGPIFRLIRLREFGPEITKSRAYKRWQDNMLKKWAATLDLVIWLDAPGAILAKRIETRSSRHRVKGKSEQEVYRFLERYRRSYVQVISMLMAGRGPQVIRFDTSLESPEQIVDQVLRLLGLEPNEVEAQGFEPPEKSPNLKTQITNQVQLAVPDGPNGLCKRASLTPITIDPTRL